MKLKSKVGMARGPVLHRRKQSSRTETLYNDQEISEVAIKCFSKWQGWYGAWIECAVAFECVGLENIIIIMISSSFVIMILSI